MTPIRPFRTSLYLTLAIVIAAVGISGWDLLPEIPFVAVFGLFLLGAAYVLEGRWELSLRDANIVGLFLAALLGLWVIFQFVRKPTGLAETLPWPASTLPYLSPVLMVLIPAKMLRPKHIGDYWAMHALGLLAMSLACAMASDGAFVIVFVIYAVTFVWSLVTFHLYRELGPELAATQAVPAGRWRAARPALGWAVLAGAMAVPLFWITPRTGSRWELGLGNRGRFDTGLSEGPVDLNRTGTLDVNRELAFDFSVQNAAGEPFLDFPVEQRFRVKHLQLYEGGRWDRSQSGIQTLDRSSTSIGSLPNPRERLTNFGPDTLTVFFSVGQKVSRTPPLLDPIVWRIGEPAPIVSRTVDHGYRSWVHRHDGSYDGSLVLDGKTAVYVQSWRAPTKIDEGQPHRIQAGSADSLARVPRGLPRLREYTNEVVARFAADGRLPKAVLTELDPITRGRAPKYHEAVARLLEHHLSGSGEFSYSLELIRTDKTLDPIEDFVLNTKAGHCQRFATALTLMLRTQGIPAQFVLGYRGCEPRGDGTYDVREDQAHAWVEALVPTSDAGLPPVNVGPGAIGDWVPVKWLMLDPTPSGGGDDPSAGKSLLGQRWEAILKALLLAYNKDSREQTLSAVEDWVTEGSGRFVVPGVLCVIGAFVFWRRSARARRAARRDWPDYLATLLAALKKRGLAWRPDETAREFAQRSAESLPGPVADVPGQIVRAYYAERFGGRTPADHKRAELTASLARLAMA